MIYLFVTGKSSAYLDDIFTTLHLPCGMRHCYIYPRKDDSPTVAPDADEKACHEGDTVLISYFDKTAVSDERLYIPLRYGKLNSCELSEGQFYYDVTLQEYCCAEDEAAYSKHILGISKGTTRRQDENGYQNGYLVIRLEGAWTEDEFVQKDPAQGWSRTVRLLADRALFQEVYPVFTKLELSRCPSSGDTSKKGKRLRAVCGSKLELSRCPSSGDTSKKAKRLRATRAGKSEHTNQKGKALTPVEDKEYGYDFIIGKEYTVHLTYIIPLFNADTMSSIPVSLRDSRDVCGVLQKEYFMGSRQGKVEFRLWPVRKTDVLLTSLAISISENQINNKSIRYSKKAIDVRVRNRLGKGWKYALQVLCVTGVCVSSFLTALPYKDIIDKTTALIAANTSLTGLQRITYEISCLLERHSDVYGLLCGIIMSISTFLLVKFTGKAKL